MKEDLTAIILLEYLKENLEVLHPPFKLYLALLCKSPLKYYSNLLALKTFL